MFGFKVRTCKSTQQELPKTATAKPRALNKKSEVGNLVANDVFVGLRVKGARVFRYSGQSEKIWVFVRTQGVRVQGEISLQVSPTGGAKNYEHQTQEKSPRR